MLYIASDIINTNNMETKDCSFARDVARNGNFCTWQV
jgi:hypothetical protein